MKLGCEKRKVYDKAYSESVEHNLVPGRAYNIEDPASKLINMVAGGFFNESKYYDPENPTKAYLDLLTTGKLTNVIDKNGLTAQSRELLECAQAIATSDNAEDLLIIASWLRDKSNGMKIRTTPQILLALAAANKKSSKFVRKYAPFIINRADDIVQVFSAFRHLYHNGKSKRKGSLPHCLKKCLADAFKSFSLYELFKYDGSNFKDVLLMIDRKSDYPLEKSVFEWFVNRKITDDAPSVLKSRKVVFSLKNIDDLTPELVKDAQLTWENIKSLFPGNDAKIWELCIPIMGEMAIVRNLRNFEEANISEKSWNFILEKMNKIEKTNQLPFRFFTADREVKSSWSKSILSSMLDRSVCNLPNLFGKTLVLIDNSGSCQSNKISKDSVVSVADAGNMLGSVLAKRLGVNATVGVFGDCFMYVPLNVCDSTITIKKSIDNMAIYGNRIKSEALGISKYGNGVGGGTETGLWFALDDITKKKLHFDRIILLSDLCCYTQGDVNCSVNMTKYFGPKATIQGLIDKYCHSVNSKVFVHSINLNGYSQAQTKEKGRSFLLSGWSENIVKIIYDLESASSESQVDVPTIEILRKRYQVK